MEMTNWYDHDHYYSIVIFQYLHWGDGVGGCRRITPSGMSDKYSSEWANYIFVF